MDISNIAVQALNVYSVSLQVIANNIANISTDDFVPERVDLETGEGGFGVEISEIVTSPKTAFEPDVVNHIFEGQVEGNKVELENEMVNLIETENAFVANTQVIKTAQDIDRVLLDMIV